MIRVLLVDAERSLHTGLRMRLQREPDIEIVGQADSLGAALEMIVAVQPEVILIDPAGLGGDTNGTVEKVSRSCSRCRVVVLSLRDDPESRRAMLLAGASAFVSKHENSEPLADVVRRVAL